jgi:hypothetical protein
MKISKLYFYIFFAWTIFFNINVQADQESEKGRLDDCFTDLAQLGNEMNMAQGSDDAPRINQKFITKKSHCHEVKGVYEKKYGKYKLPKQNHIHVISQIESDKQDPDMVRKEACNAKFNMTVHENNRAKDTFHEYEKSEQLLVEAVQRYKKATGKTLETNYKTCPEYLQSPEAEAAQKAEAIQIQSGN